MSVKAFVIHDEELYSEFAEAFLKSPDFDVTTLKYICDELGLSLSGTKNELAARISSAITIANDYYHDRASRVIEGLCRRDRKWLTIYQAAQIELHQLAAPHVLAVAEGEGNWYGPVMTEGASWYIRPVLLPHWEEVAVGQTDDGRPSREFQPFRIRWLFFARVVSHYVSFHWHGFNYAESKDVATNRNSRFPYWNHVPTLINEFSTVLNAELTPLNFHYLVFRTLWDKYRLDGEHYRWEDTRIRAEASGVSLNARAGAQGPVELDVRGIRHLAQVVRRAVEDQLKDVNPSLDLDGALLDEVILRTLIQDFGALSYEFDLARNEGEQLFRGHVYFGQAIKPYTEDCFPHVNVFVSVRKDIDQMAFLLEHVQDAREDKSVGQLTLFP